MSEVRAESENEGAARRPIARPADEIARRQLGASLRHLRRERGMSLSAAAAASGLSRSFIAMVENGSTEIAVSRLIRLAGAYGAFAADLITEVHSTVEPELVREAETYRVPTSAPLVEVRYLASASWGIQPFALTLLPGGRLEGLAHAGTEFIHCIEGHVRMTVGDAEHDLHAGDTIVIPEQVEHAYANGSDTPTRIVGGVERPTGSSPARPR